MCLFQMIIDIKERFGNEGTRVGPSRTKSYETLFIRGHSCRQSVDGELSHPHNESMWQILSQTSISNSAYRPTPIDRHLSTDTYRPTLIDPRSYSVKPIGNLGPLLGSKAEAPGHIETQGPPAFLGTPGLALVLYLSYKLYNYSYSCPRPRSLF